jgi:hypothetical protein
MFRKLFLEAAETALNRFDLEQLTGKIEEMLGESLPSFLVGTLQETDSYQLQGLFKSFLDRVDEAQLAESAAVVVADKFMEALADDRDFLKRFSSAFADEIDWDYLTDRLMEELPNLIAERMSVAFEQPESEEAESW